MSNWKQYKEKKGIKDSKPSIQLKQKGKISEVPQAFNFQTLQQKSAPLIIETYSVSVGFQETHAHDVIVYLLLVNSVTSKVEFEKYFSVGSNVRDYYISSQELDINLAKQSSSLIADYRNEIYQIISSRLIVGYQAKKQIKQLSLSIPTKQVFDIEQTQTYGSNQQTKSIEELSMIIKYPLQGKRNALLRTKVIQKLFEPLKNKIERERKGFWFKK